jgi:cytochrome c553
MKRAKRVLKWSALVIICLIVAIQFAGPVRSNPPVDRDRTASAQLQMTPQVQTIIDRACADCHSNETRWPWYSHVAPVSWFVVDHVNDGRNHLNLSEWGRYSRQEAQGLLKQMCKESSVGSMPLGSYVSMHQDAKLSSQDVKALCDWASSQAARLR